MNQEAFGAPTDLPWGMVSQGTDNVAVHPCFFYESVWCLLGFVILHFYGKYRQRYAGQIFFNYLVWYGFERMIVEGLRTDSLYMHFQIFGNAVRVSQLLSAIIFIVGIVMLLINIKRKDSFYADYRRKKVSAQVKQEVKNETELLKKEYSITPGLAVVIVGDDPASRVYVNNKRKPADL